MVRITLSQKTMEQLNDYLNEKIGMRGIQNDPSTRDEVFMELIETFCRASTEETQLSVDVSDEVNSKLETCLDKINKSDLLILHIVEWNKELDEKISDALSKI